MFSECFHLLELYSMVSFGKNLAELRKKRQLTQLELANLLDVQPRMLGRWEQDEVKPHFDYVVKLADTLEVSLDQLIKGDKKDALGRFEIKNKRLKELCKKVDKLKPKDQEVICYFLDLAVRHNQLKRIVSASMKSH